MDHGGHLAIHQVIVVIIVVITVAFFSSIVHWGPQPLSQVLCVSRKILS